MKTIIGLLLSFLYVFGVVIFAQKVTSNHNISRKISHVLHGFWWFIALIFFDSVFAAIIPPACFVLINYLSLHNSNKNIMSGLLRTNQKSELGIILYPVSLVFLVVLSYGIVNRPLVGGIGVMTLAFGDGLASYCGQKFPVGVFYFRNNQKTLSGCFSMFLSSTISLIIYLIITTHDASLANIAYMSITISIIAMITEIITPSNYDNLTVPIISTVFYLLLFT